MWSSEKIGITSQYLEINRVFKRGKAPLFLITPFL
jgi:hypothetical protein